MTGTISRTVGCLPVQSGYIHWLLLNIMSKMVEHEETSNDTPKPINKIIIFFFMVLII